MLAYVQTDIGLIRAMNEDSYVFKPPHLLAVADGMGGHVAGEIASNIAAEMLSQYIAEAINNPMELIETAICHANREIYRKALQNEQCSGMGTTVTAVYVDDDIVYWGHVGDSRLYLLHEAQLTQITSDHSLVAELVRNGSISPEEAYYHPQRNLLIRAVGTSYDLMVDIGKFNWQPDDKLILCTDGLTNMVSEPDMVKIINTSEFSLAASNLVKAAKLAGGRDNITVIVAKYEENP